MNLNEPVPGTTGHHGAKVEACKRYCVYMCGVGVAQHAENIPGRADRAAKTANDIADLQNKQMVYVPNKIQESIDGGQTSTITTERLLQSCGGIGWALGQDLRCVSQ